MANLPTLVTQPARPDTARVLRAAEQPAIRPGLTPLVPLAAIQLPVMASPEILRPVRLDHINLLTKQRKAAHRATTRVAATALPTLVVLPRIREPLIKEPRLPVARSLNPGTRIPIAVLAPRAAVVKQLRRPTAELKRHRQAGNTVAEPPPAIRKLRARIQRVAMAHQAVADISSLLRINNLLKAPPARRAVRMQATEADRAIPQPPQALTKRVQPVAIARAARVATRVHCPTRLRRAHHRLQVVTQLQAERHRRRPISPGVMDRVADSIHRQVNTKSHADLAAKHIERVTSNVGPFFVS
jgi:hypothetical protein